MRVPTVFLALFLSGLCPGLVSDVEAQEELHQVVVMTFNIRYGTAADGEDGWPGRRSLVADLITGQRPNVLAIQEGLAFQLEELEESPPLAAFFQAGFRSAFLTLHPGSDQGTFNGFSDPTGGDRIDHILLDPRVRALRAEILDQVVDGAWPSDHFPVVATISISPSPLPPLLSSHPLGSHH